MLCSRKMLLPPHQPALTKSLPTAVKASSPVRRATTIMETLVATAILTTAMIGVGRFRSSTTQGLHDQELNARLSWELSNARERIGAWPVEEITTEHIESLPFSVALKDLIEEPAWRASVAPIDDPIEGLQVTLKLQCKLYEQTVQPKQLTFWVAKPSQSDALTDAQSSSNGASQ